MRQMLTTALVLLMATAALAVTPNQINYQGRLTTPGGTPVADGSYTVVFTIYNADVGGTVQWTETQAVTTISGSFTVTLGALNPILNQVFVGSTSYLGVKVGTDPEMVPRIALVSVPYAMRVASVDSAAGGAISGNITLLNSTASVGNIYKGTELFLHNFGMQNTFMGLNAGNLSLTGHYNTGVGVGSLQSNSSGDVNTSVGWSALWKNTEGQCNTALGAGTLSINTTGNHNTACGYLSLAGNTTGGANTTTGSNSLVSNTIGQHNTAAGMQALKFNTIGSCNSGFGSGALFSNRVGDNNTAIGCSADVSDSNLTNATAIGAGAVVNASNKIRLGNGAVTVIEGQVAYTFTSDRNQKENFQTVDGAEVLSKIRNMSLASWNYKGNDPAKFRHYGPVAQEFFAAFGHDDVGQCGDSVTINSGDMAGITLIGVQALVKENDHLKAELASVKAELNDIKAMLQSTSH